MSVHTPARAGVSMENLLAAKEQRAARQQDWLNHYQQPVISHHGNAWGGKRQYSLSQYDGCCAAGL